jgi:hypothetical protein
MRTTQIKIAQYIGSMYGGDIMGELETKKEFAAPIPEYPQSAKAKQNDYEKMVRATQRNALASLWRRESWLKKQLSTIPSTKLDEIDKVEEKISEVKNDILRAEYEINAEVELPLTEEEKGEWRQSQKAYGDRCTKHILNQQKAFAIIIGQCTQRLQDKLHDDSQWESINLDQKPLELYTLIEKVVMKQTGDEYAPQNLVENLLAVLTLKQQNNQSNAQWYEKLNTWVEVAESVGVQFNNFPSLWNYCCEAKSWNEYDSLTTAKQSSIRAESKERLLAYILITNSSNTTVHDSVRNNLLEAFIAKRGNTRNRELTPLHYSTNTMNTSRRHWQQATAPHLPRKARPKLQRKRRRRATIQRTANPPKRAWIKSNVSYVTRRDTMHRNVL